MVDRLYGFGAYGSGAYGTDSTTDGDTEDTGLISRGYDTLGWGGGPWGGGIIVDLDPDTLPETPYFGGGLHGQGLYAYQQKQMDVIRNAWDSGGVNLHPESDARGVLSALAMPLGLVSDDIVEINAAHHIMTAHGGELDKIGALANVIRQTNESDARFRLRIIATMRAGTTGTTHEDILQFIAALLQIPSERVDIDWAFEFPGAAIVRIQRVDLRNALITADDLAQFATAVAPAGHRIIVELGGTFEFESNSHAVPPEHGFSSDTFTGGTLSERL